MAHRKSSYRNNDNRPSREEGGCDSCPHWSRATQSCLIVKDGLYLPATEHIITYCETPYFASCCYYQQYMQQLQYNVTAGSSWGDRRQYDRQPFRQFFRFSEKVQDSSGCTLRDSDACTIDLGEGGIRFETRENIPVDTQIVFFLEGEHGSFHGVGRVVWSRPLESSPLFHCGFVFTDSGSYKHVKSLLADLIS